MTITEKAKENLEETLKSSPGKVLRIFIQGYG